MMKRQLMFLSLVVILLISVVAVNILRKREDLTNRKVGQQTPTPSPQRIESAQLTALPGYDGGGLATRYLLDGKFRHYVEVDLPVAPNGKFYEGWLVKDEEKSEYFSTGTLTKAGEKFVVNFESSDERYDYSKVVITLETTANGSDAKPEDHVLEGNF